MQVEDANDINVVMPVYNLIEYIDNYSKTSRVLWQYCKDEPYIDPVDNNIADFTEEEHVTNSFKMKEKTNGKTGDDGTKDVEIMVAFVVFLINCEINLDLNWSKTCAIVITNVADQGATFSITDTKLYVPAVTSSTQDNTKLLEKLKSGFKRTINWNEYQLKISTERSNQYLD